MCSFIAVLMTLVLQKQTTVPGDIDMNTAIDSILSGHDALVAVLSARHRNLLLIKTMWTTGNIKVLGLFFM